MLLHGLLLLTLLQSTHGFPGSRLLPTQCYPTLPLSRLPRPPPNTRPELVILGIGTQNYSCVDSAPVSQGAVASLFDITALQYAQHCVDAQRHPSVVQIGHHFFTSDRVPTFEIGKVERPFLFSGTKASSVPAPPTSLIPSVDWLYLTPNLTLPNEGSIQSVYRVKTRGGAPISPCVGPQRVPYKAEYWFYT